MGLRDRLRTVFRLFALFTVMVGVALVSAITTIRLTIHGRQITTPNLVGISLDNAQRITSGMGLDLKIEDKIFTDQYKPDQIVSQIPPKGTRVKLGQHIHVLVSLGKPRVKVPELIGDTVRAAQIMAFQRGLTVGDVATVHSVGGVADSILAQDPPPAKPDVQGPAVNLLVSLGEPTAAYLCPNYVGRPMEEARRALEKAGFKVGLVTPVPSSAAVLNTILSQSPPAGSKIEAGSTLNFQVAAPGSPAVVPLNAPPTVSPQPIPPK
jgi:serine/threonine-protein kinase